ncbi:MAG: hypothetical protein AAF666_18775 [Pseudomonadota bacterium]
MRIPFPTRLTAAVLLCVFASGAPGTAAEPQITQAEAENAAQSVARFCKILISRMEDLINDQWATQDLQDLAAVWDSLDCHQVFGVDERVRWLLR